MDWQETLERAIPQPPPAHPDPAALLADGKKLVRRRRLAVVAGTAAAVAAVVGIGAIVVPSRDSATPNPPIATQSTAEDEWPPEADIPLSDLAPVAYDHGTGEVTLYRGWKETDQVGPLDSGNALAVAATKGNRTVYVHFMNPTEIAYTDASRTSATSLRAWVDDVRAHHLSATWNAGGKLRVKQNGWEIVREIPNPLGYAAPWDSVGAVVEREGVEQWILYSGNRPKDGGESSGLDAVYAIPGQTIEEWLAVQVATDRKDYRPGNVDFSIEPTEAVEFGSGSEVVSSEDRVKIVEQVADPDIGHSFATGTSRTAAARITVGSKERYVLVREKDGVTQAYSFSVLPAPRAEDRRPLTLDEFAEMVDRRMTPGSGLW
ncbi:hypothetical protein [Nocardioides sp. NPDC006303]|uniref:hypothetical protein n=1 Tax=Nocardioides sp. NPDC006303 TaxID=3156747 RepID=UPI0033B71487